MAFIQDLSRQFGGFIGAQPMARKLTLLAIIIGSIGAMVFLVIHAQTGSYAVLYQGLDPSDSGEIVRVLSQKGISFRTENSNSIIKVPAGRVDEAFMLVSMEGLPNSGTVGYEGLDKSTIGQSNFAQQKNYKRMQEGELARTMVKFEGVEQARVLIAVPDETPFLSEQQKATASVQLKMRTGYQLTERQISGITHLVSHAIKGLDDANVVIVDQKGNLLNQSRAEDSQNSIAQQQFKLGYEDRLKHEIESLIENTIGRGRVAARVQADFNYASQKEERQTFNPEAQDPIPTKEQIESEPAKTAAAATTVTTAAATTASGPTRSTREFAVSQQRTETENNVPTLKRVTVAVLADGKHTEKNGKDEYTPLTDSEIANIENLVKATIGYSEERGDMVTVQCSPFTTNELMPTEDVGWFSPDLRRILEMSLHWGIVGLIGLMLILMVLRPAVKQITVSASPMAALPGAAGGRQWIEAGAGAAGAAGADQVEGSMAAKLLGNTDQARMFQAQQAAENARMSQAQAQQIQREVIETTKNQPQKTVSLLRQWMDEA